MNRLERINPNVHLALTWSAVPLIVFFFIGMVPLSGFIPPPSPSDTAQEVVNHYTDNLTAVRVGLIVSALSFTLMFAWGASIAVWTARIEKGFPGLTFTQLMCCAGGSALTFLIFLIWSVASFRAGTGYDAETVRMLNDFGWFCFLWIVPPFGIWSAAMGIAILSDKREKPIYPRWVAYVCFWEALLMQPALLIVFFKHGAFAINGLLAFYVPVAAFFVWMCVMTLYTHKAIRRQVREDAEGKPDEAAGAESPREASEPVLTPG